MLTDETFGGPRESLAMPADGSQLRGEGCHGVKRTAHRTMETTDTQQWKTMQREREDRNTMVKMNRTVKTSPKENHVKYSVSLILSSDPNDFLDVVPTNPLIASGMKQHRVNPSIVAGLRSGWNLRHNTLGSVVNECLRPMILRGSKPRR